MLLRKKMTLIVTCMEQSWTTFVLLFLVQMVQSGENVVRNQTWSTTCSDTMLVVNCSYRGIFIHNETSYLDTFVCNMCCPLESCCDLIGNITLKMTCFDSFRNVSKGNETKKDDVNRKNTDDATKRQYFEYLILDLNNNITKYNDTAYTCHGDMGNVSGFNGSYNDFKKIPRFDCWTNLQWIDLSNNGISIITQNLSFGHLSSLRTLYFRSNSLYVTHPSALAHLSSLQYLYLNDNPHIADWYFVNCLPNLKVVYITGPCDQTFITDNFCQPDSSISSFSYVWTCSNESVYASNIECKLLSAWPNTSFSLPSLVPCFDSGYTTLHDTSFIPTTTPKGTGETDTHEISESLCHFFSDKKTLYFLSSDHNCIWMPVSGVACVIFLCLVVVAFIRWRHHVKRQGRYSRWLSVYSSQSSRSNEREIERYSLENKSSDLSL